MKESNYSKGFSVNSVTRLSDGLLITVGDIDQCGSEIAQLRCNDTEVSIRYSGSSVYHRLSSFTPMKVVVKNYKILECVSQEGVLHDAIDIEYCMKHGCKIHAVKRLPDGEVFSVGDEIVVGYSNNNYRTVGVIKEFRVNKHFLITVANDKSGNEWVYGIDKLKKYQPQCDCTGEEHDQNCPYSSLVSDTWRVSKKYFGPIKDPHSPVRSIPLTLAKENFWDEKSYEKLPPFLQKEQPKRVEVKSIDVAPRFPTHLSVTMSEPVEKNKMGHIKVAIEALLNQEITFVQLAGDPTIQGIIYKGDNFVRQKPEDAIIPEWKKMADHFDAVAKLKAQYGHLKYTQADINKAREEGFYAGRLRHIGNQTGEIRYFDGGSEPHYPFVNKSFSVYKSKIK